ncbi:MAG TPA: Fic family protein [Pyrinomonadaceae bacterium]|nr:Fic family protein [Pyrinomonadaceae bacterium]
MRSGNYIKQPGGYKAFSPAPLPPDPPVAMDAELTRLLSEADRSLGRLDGIGSVLPNPDLFVAMYVRQEAVLSSQIEGTQSTLEDVLQFEVDAKGLDLPRDVEEVVNYVRAMKYGIARLNDFPLSLRLIREIHAQLLEGVRGANRDPGEFRKSQNWIGPAGANLASASFVPPAVPEMREALDKFEKFLHDDSLPILIHCGLTHAQFETIHPFLDGNGRVGRLLITFLLCERKTLHRPLLYLSHYLRLHRAEYYDRLMAIRNHGDWEGWLKFFLRGVIEVSTQAIATSRGILALREEHRAAVNRELGSSAASGLHLLEYLYEQPIVTVRIVEQHMRSSFVTASRLVEHFCKLEILNETTGGKRNRRYSYIPYLELFESSATKTEGRA